MTNKALRAILEEVLNDYTSLSRNEISEIVEEVSDRLDEEREDEVEFDA